MVIILTATAADFFINVALFRDSKWFEKTGHKMMNPDNFATVQTEYNVVEQKQLSIGSLFWDNDIAQDYWLEADDEKLYARLFKTSKPTHEWVICVHGYRSNGKRDMSYTAYRFYEQGYQCLVPDLRAHGKSSGNIIGMGWLDRLDIEKWISEIIKLDAEAKIILFGGSMGASTVMMVSGDNLPENVVGIIADCGYSSVYAEFGAMLSSALKLPKFPILTFANIFARRKVGYSLKTASAVKQLEKNKRPILFIHGTGDKFVPHQMMYDNMEAASGVKESLVIEGAPHLSSAIYEPEHYYETVFEFIQRYC
nr:alpha/beta hydrolase [Vagococcus vulneris]